MVPDAYAEEDSFCFCFFLVSMGGEAFGPVNAHFPNVGECQGAEVGKGGWKREHLHGGNERWREDGIGGKG